MTNLTMMRHVFGQIASDSGYFVLLLAFGFVVSTLAAFRRAGWL
jgi:hypothetical protein